MSNQHIAIIGAGTAGLSSAIFLARQGYRVSVFERVPNMEPVGAGVLLQPSGMSVLYELGLFDECAALGAPIQCLFGTSACDHGERVILNTRYKDWQVNSYGMGIHRAVLLRVLLNAAKSVGVEIHTGVEITRFTPTSRGVCLDHVVGQFSALILASGTYSTLRAQMNVRQRVKPYPWGALWAIVPTPDGSNSLDLRQWYRGCSQMFGIMPTGLMGKESIQKTSSLFWSLPTHEYSNWLEQGLDQWKEQVQYLAGSSALPFLAQIDSVEQLAFAAYADVKMDCWYDGRVIAIGDCAHAMSPQLGQGANMALVDASILGRAWCADIDTTFKTYAAMRYQHLRYYRQASRALTPLFQSHYRLAWLRDMTLYAARHTKIGRHHAVTTLVGARTGWLTNRYPEESLHVWNGCLA